MLFQNQSDRDSMFVVIEKNLFASVVLEGNSSSSTRIYNLTGSYVSFVQQFTSGSSQKG